MVRHVLAWQSASVTRAPFVGRGLSIIDRAQRPIAHITRQRRLRDLLDKGDTIWIVGKYPALSDATASIIGRIIVAKKHDDGMALEFFADYGSCWLPWNDASQLLCAVELKTNRGATFLSPNVGIAQQLQTTREVWPSSLGLLDSYADNLLKRPSVFVSYRWATSADLMQHLLPALTHAGYAVWVDRWSGPRRFREKGTFQPEEVVKSLLSDAIRKADLMISVTSADYHNGLWTSYEASTAEAEGRVVISIADELLRQHIQTGTLNSFIADAAPRRGVAVRPND